MYAECDDATNTANVHFYYPEDCLPPSVLESDLSGSEPLPPYFPGARCDFYCPQDGYYATIETMPNVHQTCVKCPDNTVSVNGGYLLDFKMEDPQVWYSGDESALKVKTDCQIFELSDFWEPDPAKDAKDPFNTRFYNVNTECDSWTPTGRSMKTPQLSTYNETKQAMSYDTVELAEYKLVIRDTFHFAGSVEFRYRANTALVNGYKTPNGVFKFLVDGWDMRAVSDHYLHGQWITSSFDIPPGFHVLEWVYLKYLNLHGESHEDLAAEVEWIKVVGTQYTPFECQPCAKGVSNEDRTKC
jgi:hypothetical protein